jgi:hypothetical protein
MAKNATTDEVAAELRAALDGGPKSLIDAAGRRFGDKVEVVHEPAMPSDGVMDGAELRTMTGNETAAIEQGIPDASYEGTVTVDGDDITVNATLSGSLPDGDTFAVTIPMMFTVKDGEVVRMGSKLDPGVGEQMMKAFSSAGIEIPDAPQPS